MNLTNQIAETILSELDGIITGGHSSLKKFGEEIAASLIANAKKGNRAGVDECVAQAKALVETHRIKANKAAWKTVERVVRITAGVLLGIEIPKLTEILNAQGD